jgi:hypothetical protein
LNTRASIALALFVGRSMPQKQETGVGADVWVGAGGLARQLIRRDGLEDDVTNQGRVMVASLVGAFVGGLTGYLYLTDPGRRLRSQLEPRLDNAAREIARLRQTVVKAQAVYAEGWRSLSQVAGNSWQHAEWGSPRQTSPH